MPLVVGPEAGAAGDGGRPTAGPAANQDPGEGEGHAGDGGPVQHEETRGGGTRLAEGTANHRYH